MAGEKHNDEKQKQKVCVLVGIERGKDMNRGCAQITTDVKEPTEGIRFDNRLDVEVLIVEQL